MHKKISSAKRRTVCLGLNVLRRDKASVYHHPLSSFMKCACLQEYFNKGLLLLSYHSWSTATFWFICNINPNNETGATVVILKRGSIWIILSQFVNLQSFVNNISFLIQKRSWFLNQYIRHLTYKQLETYRCVPINVATDVLVLKHQAISTHGAGRIISDDKRLVLLSSCVNNISFCKQQAFVASKLATSFENRPCFQMHFRKWKVLYFD